MHTPTARRALPALAALLLALGAPALAHAEDAPAAEEAATEEAAPRGTIQIDPLTMALGYWHIQFERRLGDRVSLYAGPHLRLYDSVFSDTREAYRGLGAELGVRYFLRGGAPQGLWLGARGVAARLTTHASIGEEATFGGYGSALVGYTWVPIDHLVLSGGAGVQYLHYTIAGLGTEGILPALHTAIGVTF